MLTSKRRIGPCFLHRVSDATEELPEPFQRDYSERFDDESALEIDEAAEQIHAFLADRPHIVGAVPNFDTERIGHQLLIPSGLIQPWHYHLVDVENLAVGYIIGAGKQAANDGVLGEIDLGKLAPPWSSDELSMAVGVDPAEFDRHTAMGDVQWVMAQYDAIMGRGAS